MARQRTAVVLHPRTRPPDRTENLPGFDRALCLLSLTGKAGRGSGAPAPSPDIASDRGRPRRPATSHPLCTCQITPPRRSLSTVELHTYDHNRNAALPGPGGRRRRVMTRSATLPGCSSGSWGNRTVGPWRAWQSRRPVCPGTDTRTAGVSRSDSLVGRCVTSSTVERPQRMRQVF